VCNFIVDTLYIEYDELLKITCQDKRSELIINCDFKTGLRGSVIGIFGLGKIGMAIAARLTAFGIKKVIYTNRRANEAAKELNYEFVEFDQLLAESDYLICAASLNSDSEGMFNLEAFSKMKRTSSFFNVGRGGMVNHEDLYEALNSQIICSAGKATVQRLVIGIT